MNAIERTEEIRRQLRIARTDLRLAREMPLHLHMASDKLIIGAEEAIEEAQRLLGEVSIG